MDKLRKSGVTEEELAKAKEAFLQGEKVRRADDGSLAGLLLASMFNRRTLQFTADYEKRVSELTVPQVNDAINKFIVPDRLITAVGGDFSKASE